jgi:CubicO group peptidase (beta-lactamase class C family)
MENPIVGLAADAGALAERLAGLPSVPGVQVATVSPAGAIATAAAGVTDTESGAPVTVDTRFRPGSITKLLTATLVLQCVDDDVLGLDDPVTAHVHRFQLADPADAERVTVRHLLGHCSGIDAGDLFVDTGEEDGGLAAYVALLADAGLLFEPGRWMSYNNAGFVLAGHLVEQVRGEPWEVALRTRVLEPLGMASTTFQTGADVADALGAAPAGAFARGHLAGFGGLMALPPETMRDDPMCTRGLGPAGSTLTSTAGDLARLAAAHLGVGGVAGAAPILSPSSAALMRELHGRAPGGVTKMAGVGLAWQLWRSFDGQRLVPRIGGANPGQSGLIAADPDVGCAVVVLTNSDQGVGAMNALLDGLGPAAVPDDDPAPADLSVYAGRYRSHIMDVDVAVNEAGDGLELRLGRVEDPRWGSVKLSTVMGGVPSGPAVGAQTWALSAVDRTTFATPLGPLAFLDRDDDGRPALLRWRMRVQRRVSD